MSATMPADAVIFVLLDAFRHDYLGRTRFLRQLAPLGLVGRLEEPFGFCPRGAYLGGLSMNEQGYTHLFHHNPRSRTFAWTADLAGTGLDDRLAGWTRPDIIARAQAALPPFAAGSVNPWGIPLAWQSFFDVSEQHAPWSPEAGYRSLFHQLDEAAVPWMERSWPFGDLGAGATDGSVIGAALQRMETSHRFVFIHLPSLDAAGHQYGPGSREVQRTLLDADRLCDMLTARALELYRDPVLLFAGDHGMVPVVRTVDPWHALTTTGLRFGHDLTFFVDSTMVRCWFETTRARAEAVAALDTTGGGRWLDASDRFQYGIDRLDRRNGDAYFLADPGVVFSPSFFGGSGPHVPRGMHGYAPDVADNQGLFLAYRPMQRTHARVGVVEARRLYPTFLEWLGWSPIEFTDARPVSAADAEGATSGFFASSHPVAETHVAANLATAVSAITSQAPAAHTVLLAGGFGRGEGTPDPTGTRAANDYDLLVLGGDGTATAGLGDRLAGEFGLDYVDISAGPGLTDVSTPRLCDFDLRYGARVLFGDPAAVERLRAFAPAELDAAEAALVVGNRLGGVLLALSGERPSGSDPEAFRARQFGKCLVAIADAWLITIGDYSVSYADRRRRFSALAVAGGFDVTVAAAIDIAYAAKLGLRSGGLLAALPLQALVAGLDALDRLTGWSDDNRRADLTTAIDRHLTDSDAWRERAASLGLMAAAPWPTTAVATYDAVRRTVRAWTAGPSARLESVHRALDAAFTVSPVFLNNDPERRCARLWLGFFH